MTASAPTPTGLKLHLKQAMLAVQFMTRVPLPALDVSAADFHAAIRWFPLAGLVVGSAVALAFALGGLISPWLATLAGVAAWVWVTGALHLDGLGDLVDGLAASHGDPDKLCAVMKDPHIGSFGVSALVLQLLAKTILLHEVALASYPHPAMLLAVVLIPALARVGPLLWTLWLPPLHAGLGSTFRAGAGPLCLALWAVGLLLAALLIAPALWATVGLLALWGFWLKHKLGGISGDCHGAGIELCETGLLLALIIAGTL